MAWAGNTTGIIGVDGRMQTSAGDMTAERFPSAPAGGLFLHRETETAVLAQCWDALRAGHPSVVLIKGERGSGKSALLARALTMLPEPSVVLRARCTETEKHYALGVVGQLFNRLNDTDQTTAGATSHDVMNGLFQTTKSLSVASPVVIAIDDLHLADKQSLEWFSYITRRLDDLPVTVIATVAADVVGIPELDAPQMTTILTPGPLCDSCTEELAGEVLGGPLDPGLAAACYLISRGNPLVLNDFLRRLQIAGITPGAPDLELTTAIGTTTLADTVVEWLHQRDAAAADLLAGLAVLGPAADPAVAAILVGQGEYVAGRSWETLNRAGLVDTGPISRFANSLLGAAALSRIDTAERLRMHARAAELLMRLGSPATEAAEHVLLVGGSASEDAPAILRSAAQAAAEVGDWADAVRYLRRGLAESLDPAVTSDLSAQLGAIELHHDLRSSLRYAATTGSTILDPAERAKTLMPLVSSLLAADAGAAARVFVEVSAELARSSKARSAVDKPTLMAFGAMSLLLGHRTGVRRWMRELPRLSPADFEWESEQRTAGSMLGSLAVLAAAGGKHRRSALRLAGRSAAVADGIGMVAATLTYSWAGELAVAEEHASRMTNSARSSHHLAELALALAIRADVAMRRGHLMTALHDAQEAVRLAELTNARGLLCAATSTAALCLLEQGQLAEAASILRPGSPAAGHPLIVGANWHAQSVLALARGNADEALRLALESGHQLTSHGIANPAAVRWRSAAVMAYLALGATQAAVSLASQDVVYSRRWGSAASIGAALTTLSYCLTGPERSTVSREAVALLEGTGADLDLAGAVVALAQSMRADGLHPEATQQQHRACDLRDRCGAVRDPGGLPDAAKGPESRMKPRRVRLTTSEARVSNLVLQGMSNQEVADELCISRRTVDTHLNRIYRKLEIRSRTELGAALDQLP